MYLLEASETEDIVGSNLSFRDAVLLLCEVDAALAAAS